MNKSNSTPYKPRVKDLIKKESISVTDQDLKINMDELQSSRVEPRVYKYHSRASEFYGGEELNV